MTFLFWQVLLVSSASDAKYDRLFVKNVTDDNEKLYKETIDRMKPTQNQIWCKSQLWKAVFFHQACFQSVLRSKETVSSFPKALFDCHLRTWKESDVCVDGSIRLANQIASL